MSRVTRLNEPAPIRVRVNAERHPCALLLRRRWTPVEHVLDRWCIDDRWWTDEPVRRHYFSCQTTTGSVVTVFYDLAGERWYAHRA